MTAPLPESLDLSRAGVRESLRDCVAFARAVSSMDTDGAFEVWRTLDGPQRMQLAINLAGLLNWALVDAEGWAEMVEAMEL